MFTVVVSYHAERAYDMAVNFADNIKGGDHIVVATKFSEEVTAGDDKSATVTQHITSKTPETLFRFVEEMAQGGLVIPEELQDIYFEGAVYYIHAIPKDVTIEQMTYVLNIALNCACINRVNYNNMRNMYLTDRQVAQAPVNPMSLKSIQDAINILSNKVLGAELLTTINDKEEVKWPVH